MGARLSWASLVGAALVVSEARAQAQQPVPQPVPQPQPTSPPPEPLEPEEPAAVTTEPAPPPAMDVPAPAAPPPEPVVVRQGIRSSDAGLLIGAGALFGAGVALFFAAQSDFDDADAAVAYDDHERIEARAQTLRIASFVSAGAGITLGVLALYRIKVTREGTELAITPKKGGGALVLETSW